MSEDKRDRNRFTAIVEEMFDDAPVLQKMPQTQGKQFTKAPQFTPRIFDQTIAVTNGLPAPCPKCDLRAFTYGGSNWWCRASCGRFAEPYEFDLRDTTRLQLQQYKCGRCGRHDLVTMSLAEVNLQCWTCEQITIHTLVKRGPALRFNPIPVGEPLTYASAPEQRQWRFDYKSSVWEDLVPAGLKPNKFEALVDDARIKLGLVPFVEFTNGALARNYKLVEAGVMTMLDISRRTGRTTRGLIEAIVRASRTSIGALFMVSRTSMHEATLQRDAFEMCGRLGLSLTVSTWRGEPISDQVVYVDHSYDAQLQDRFATLRFKP